MRDFYDLWKQRYIKQTAPYTDGAQILIQDSGSGDAAVFELSRFTTAVPALAAGTTRARGSVPCTLNGSGSTLRCR